MDIVQITLCYSLFLILINSEVSNTKKTNRLLNDPRKIHQKSQKGRIVNGEEADPHEFPWLVEIRWKGVHECGGSILNPDFVLTAAHCFADDPMEELYIVAGEHNMRCREGIEQVREVVDTVIHEEYTRGVWNNDIAVVQVHPPFVYNKYVGPANLPQPQGSLTDTAIITGWGRTIPEEHRSYPGILMRAILPRGNDDFCDLRIRGYNATIKTCYGGKGSAMCSADSGGPLMCGPNMEVCGINSHGANPCNDPGQLDVFVKVPHYLDWISEHSNISKTPREVSQCDSYINQTKASIIMGNLRQGDECYWVFHSRGINKNFKIVYSTLANDDQFHLSNVTHFCEGCVAMKLDFNLNKEFTMSGNSILILSLRISNAALYREFHLEYTSTGERSTLLPFTNFYYIGDRQKTFGETTFEYPVHPIKFPMPPRHLFYYNSQDVLIIINRPAAKRKTTTITFREMDIANGDYLSFFSLQHNSGEYVKAARYSGQSIQPPLSFSGGFAIARFISAPNSLFGEGFVFEYATH